MQNCNQGQSQTRPMRPARQNCGADNQTRPMRQSCRADNQMRPMQQNCGADNQMRPAHQNCDIDQMALAMAYVPWQHFHKTYEVDKALEYGTIFPELNKPFYGRRGVNRP